MISLDDSEVIVFTNRHYWKVKTVPSSLRNNATLKPRTHLVDFVAGTVDFVHICRQCKKSPVQSTKSTAPAILSPATKCTGDKIDRPGDKIDQVEHVQLWAILSTAPATKSTVQFLRSRCKVASSWILIKHRTPYYMLLIFEVSMCVSTLRHLYVNSRRQQSMVGRLLIFRPTMELESTQSSDCPDWTDSKTITLIDLFRQHECLWKVNTVA